MRTLALALVLMTCAPLSWEVLAARQRAALQRHDWFDAVRLGQARVAGRPADLAARYDLACALARVGDDRAALRALFEAVALGFDDEEWLAHDEDLASLRGLAEFASVRAEVVRTARAGITVLGVRAVSFDNLPMPVRLRLADPAVGPARPRLVVWLHPSGARLNAALERLAPVFARHGFALALPMHPRLAGWNNDELKLLLDDTLPRLADLVDVEHPLLIGWSAGAEAALAAWFATPARFLAVWALAPPVVPLAYTRAGSREAAPSPLTFFFGDRDPAWSDWQRTFSSWRAAGVPFEARVVPGKGHELLFDEVLLERELSQVRSPPG